jgi:hypothetical protein
MDEIRWQDVPISKGGIRIYRCGIKDKCRDAFLSQWIPLGRLPWFIRDEAGEAVEMTKAGR